MFDNVVYMYSLYMVRRCVSLGVSIIKNGPQKAVLLMSAKMELSLVVATISPTLLSLW